MFLFKKKKKYPETAKYKLKDYVNFRYIYDAMLDKENKVIYTIQIAGQCPALIYNYKEEDIIGLKTN